MKKLSIKKLFKKKNLPFLAFGLGMLLVHLLAPIPIADDVFFKGNPAGIFDWAFYKGRYFEWSSRLILEFFVVAFLKLPSIIWRVLNSGVLVLLSVALSELFVEKNKKLINWFIVFLLFLFPLQEMLSAGWVTISINYIWPLTFGLLALVVVKKILLDKKIRVIEYFLSCLLLIFAVNQEIMAVILGIVFLVSAVYLILNKRFHWFVVLGLVLCLSSIIFTLTAPGNHLRQQAEIRWFIDFNYISFVEKLEIGISSTLAHYVFNFNFLFFVFSVLLAIAIFSKYKDLLYKIIALIPLVMSLVFGNGFYVIVDRLFPHLATIDTEITQYGLITLGNFTRIQSYIPLFLLLMTAFVILILIYIIFGNTWKSTIALGVLFLGLISRLILAFSPTIWSSGIRTHFLMITSFIICSIMIFQQLIKRNTGQFIETLLIAAGFIAGFSYLNLLMSV
ncbi:MAG: DUF6056 family protein [Brevefilum sp.]|nr:DUF6056 family protein [Brevefilum sp.]MDT8382197.1 DUF6056 family protein [Brevefilum sp.]MDW7754825.1 DUF6056 family protein [Brevefilum sp.]